MKVSILGWDKTNIEPDGSGGLRARSGLRRIASPPSGEVFAWMKSDKPQTTESVLHYALTRNSTTDNLTFRLYDENFQQLQEIDLATRVEPRDLSLSLVAGEIHLTSPDLRTIHSFAGSGLGTPVRGDSRDPDYPALPIPRGISVAWGGRLVVAGENLLYFSLPGEPRTFMSLGALDPPGGAIRGLHVDGAGSLILCTTTGVYSLPIEASAAGREVRGFWQKVSSHQTFGYRQTCEWRGIIFGVSRGGVAPIAPSGQEIEAVQGDVPRHWDQRFTSPDFRRDSELHSSHAGPILVRGDSAFRFFGDDRMSSWWSASDLCVLSVAQDQDGSDLLVLKDGIYRVVGNYDEGDTTAPVGTLGGRLPTAPDRSYTVRKVHVSTTAAQRGSWSETGAVAALGGKAKTMVPPATGSIVGTDSWDDTTLVLRDEPLRSRRFSFGQRSDDHVLEVGAVGCQARIGPEVTALIKGVAPGRDTD